MIKVRCGSCSKSIRVPEKYAGKTVKCPGCGSPFQVPSPADEVETLEPIDEDPLMPDPLPDPFGLPSSPEQNAPPSPYGNTQPTTGQASSGYQQPVVPQGFPQQAYAQPVEPGYAPLPPAQGGQVPQPRQDSYWAPPAVQGQPQTSYGTPAYLQNQQAPAYAPTRPTKPDQKGSGYSSSVGNSVFGLFAAAGVGLIATVVWVLLWMVTGFQLGFVAWASGAMIGISAGLIAKNPSPLFCAGAAVVAFFSFLASKIMMALVLMLGFGMLDFIDEFDDWSSDEQNVTYALKDEMTTEEVFPGAEQQLAERECFSFFQDNTILDDDYDYDVWDSLTDRVLKRMEGMSREEKNALLQRTREKYPQWMEHDYNYLAMLNLLVENGELADPGLNDHAMAAVENIAAYYDRVGFEEQDRRDKELRRIAGRKFSTLSVDEKDQALMAVISKHPEVIQDYDQFVGVLNQMINDNAFDAELQRYAEAELRWQLTDEWQNEFDIADDHVEQKLYTTVNNHLVKLDRQTRRDLVKQCKQANPSWNGGHEFAGGAGDGMGLAERETGTDGSFGSSFTSVLSLLDILWVILGCSTAFGVARQMGVDEAG